MNSTRLLNLKEVSKILSINTEVLRRWLRNKKLPGIKVGSDWRVNEKDLEPFLRPVSPQAQNEDGSQPKMCFRFPKWLEFSGLPTFLNQKYGPECWPVFKKLIELDFEQGKPQDRRITIEVNELAERVGYEKATIQKMLERLKEADLVAIIEAKSRSVTLNIVTPLKTPKMVFDIAFEKGGIKGAPSKALENNCLRRFLETGQNDA